VAASGDRVRPPMSTSAEVIVVGGGPAGSMAAMTLAARGVRVVLLDRQRFPRDKPCGGGIRFRVLDRFPELARHLRSAVPMHEVHRVWLESPAGASVVARGDRPLYLTFRRLDFDAALLQHARASGADVVEGARVTDVAVRGDRVIVTCLDGRRFEGLVVIGADGINSVVARASGLGGNADDDTIAIDTTEEAPLADLTMTDTDTMYVAYGRNGWPGYGYVFPKREHVDAGVGFILSFFKRELGGSPWEHHVRFVDEARAKGVVRGEAHREHFKAYRIPLGGPVARASGDRVLIAGDAGGFVNAYTGEGIYHAMVTGQHAGETAAGAVARRDCSATSLAEYDRRWRKEIGGELSDSVRVQRRLFADPARADRVIRAAAADPKLCRLLALVALGEESLRRRKLALAWRFAAASLRGRLRGAFTRWTAEGARKAL
jgi:geranylgeranyl reductase family protein